MSDAILRDAARLLRSGHPPDVLVDALGDDAARALLHCLAAKSVAAVEEIQALAEAQDCSVCGSERGTCDPPCPFA